MKPLEVVVYPLAKAVMLAQDPDTVPEGRVGVLIATFSGTEWDFAHVVFKDTKTLEAVSLSCIEVVTDLNDILE